MRDTMDSTGAWRAAMWGGAALLLLLPLVAMQFTDEMRWDGKDFLALGMMLLVACGAGELVLKRRGVAYRFAAALAIAGAFLTVWVHLAVGIIGDSDHPANLMFAGVLGVGLVGACIARLRPQRLMRVMIAMAICQSLVAAICLAVGWLDGLAASAALTALWLASAWMFRRAARSAGPAQTVS
jgi:hypothetical protein